MNFWNFLKNYNYDRSEKLWKKSVESLSSYFPGYITWKNRIGCENGQECARLIKQVINYRKENHLPSICAKIFFWFNFIACKYRYARASKSYIHENRYKKLRKNNLQIVKHIYYIRVKNKKWWFVLKWKQIQMFEL